MPRCEYGLWLLDAGPLEASCGDPAAVRAWFAPPGARQRLVVCLCGWHESYLCGEGGREDLPVVSRAVMRAEESARGLLG